MEFKLNGKTFNVKVVPAHNMGRGYGSSGHSDSLVKLAENLSEEQQRQTMLHELLHLIDTEHSDKNVTEQNIVNFEIGLTAFFRENSIDVLKFCGLMKRNVDFRPMAEERFFFIFGKHFDYLSRKDRNREINNYFLTISERLLDKEQDTWVVAQDIHLMGYLKAI